MMGITYHEIEFGFLVQTLQKNPLLLSQISANQFKELTTTPFAFLHAFFALTWTAIYAVKISFLVFFKKLIKNVIKIHTYYWIVGVITLISWIFVVLEPLVICQHPNQSFGTSYIQSLFDCLICSINLAKCLDPALYQISVSMSWLTNSLDVFTDLLSEFSKRL